MSQTTNFLAGVIEGFYGPPWEQFERVELLDWMARWGLNTYLYAPKDDLKHRSLWRECYSTTEEATFRLLIGASKERNIRFAYALSPGLDIRYSSDSDLQCLRMRFAQMVALGCQNFALLFDDIPVRAATDDIERFGSLGSAQCQVANSLFRWMRERCPHGRFLFCPTAYCGRMAERKLGGEGYLGSIGRELLPEIDVFWTGPEIISREITVGHVEELKTILRRKPLIWDNLHANDYDGRRFFCGPYSGRPPGLRSAVAGILSNPNTEFPLNYVPLRTMSEFLHSDEGWNPRAAYLSAMREWLPRFATVNQPVAYDDLILLGDCYYLPHEEGPEAEALYERAKGSLAASIGGSAKDAALFGRQAARLRQSCGLMSELRDRRLFHALSRRIWELREELELLERYVEFKSKSELPNAAFSSDFHLPGTYRGGMAARLQRLLQPQLDGTFRPEFCASIPDRPGAVEPQPADHGLPRAAEPQPKSR